MSISELYDLLLENNVDMQLVGEISCDDEILRWEYDGLNHIEGEMEAHLMDIWETDEETIMDFLADRNVEHHFFINEPEIRDSFIICQITEE